jgi:hypothetical protein
MNLEQAKVKTLRTWRSGQAAIWYSSSGFGKSAGAMQLARAWVEEGKAKGRKRGICIIFGATHSPSDVLGYFFKGDREIVVDITPDGKPETKKVTVTDPSIPLWMISTEGLPAFCYHEVVLIIDEWGQTDPETKKPLAEVLLHGGTHPHYLPAGSPRIALSNQGARYGVTKEWDFVIARRTEYHIRGDIDVSLKYMDKPYVHEGRQWQTLPLTKAWASSNPQIVFEDTPPQQQPWCNPRQLMAWDRYVQLTFEETGKKELDEGDMEVGQGTIGMGATTSYVSALQFRLQLPQYDEVVADPVGTLVPDRGDLQMLMAYELSHHAKPEHLAALIQYMTKRDANNKGMAKDMGITFITSLLRRDWRGMIQVPALQSWVNKNAAILSVIQSMAN